MKTAIVHSGPIILVCFSLSLLVFRLSSNAIVCFIEAAVWMASFILSACIENTGSNGSIDASCMGPL